MPIKARFVGAADSSANVVAVELFNQAQENAADTTTKEENSNEN